MRPVTRNVVVALVLVLVGLLALGALPSHLKSGDPYYVVATPATGGAPAEPFDAAALSERRYPYATGALGAATPDAPGRSEPYWEGPFGIKEGFAHSPFEEFTALERQYPNATAGDAVYATAGNTTYRLEIVREKR